MAPSTTATISGVHSSLRAGRSVAPPGVVSARVTGSIVADSITDYPPTDLRRHLTTFALFLRETNTIAYPLVHPTARPDAVADARGRFATVSTPPVRRFRVGVGSRLE